MKYMRYTRFSKIERFELSVPLKKNFYYKVLNIDFLFKEFFEKRGYKTSSVFFLFCSTYFFHCCLFFLSNLYFYLKNV